MFLLWQETSKSHETEINYFHIILHKRKLDDKQTNVMWFQYIHTILGERIFSIISGLVIVDLGTGEKI